MAKANNAAYFITGLKAGVKDQREMCNAKIVSFFVTRLNHGDYIYKYQLALAINYEANAEYNPTLN